jgi:hypothetical protein
MQKIVCPVWLEISPFYIKNTLQMYVECVKKIVTILKNVSKLWGMSNCDKGGNNIDGM